MKKYSLILFLVTAVCIIVGLAYNFKGFVGSSFKTTPELVSDEDNFGNVEVNEVKIDMDHGNISFVYGPELTVSSKYPQDELPEVTYENGVLSVKQKVTIRKNYLFNVRSTGDEFLTKVTIPEGTVIKSIESDSANCDSYFDSIEVENVTFDQTNGDVTAKECKFNNLIAHCTNGDFDISGEYANIDIKLVNDDVKVSGKLDQVKIDVTNGDIELNTEGPIDFDKVSVKTLNGDFYVNGKEIGD